MTNTPRLVIYRGLRRIGGRGLPVPGLWYWRLKARNGKTIADGAEGYVSRGNAWRAAYKAVDAMRQRVVLIEYDENKQTIRKVESLG